MYDDIVDDSPIRVRDTMANFERTHTYEGESTMPLPGYMSPSVSIATKASPASQFVTQPTQILNTPKAPQVIDQDAEVQVLASSPSADRISCSPAESRRPLASIIVPPGTRLNPPLQHCTIPTDFSSDDLPIEDDSGEEEPLRSNIKPSFFESSTLHQSRVKETPRKRNFDLSQFSYKNVPRKRLAEDVVHPQAEKKRQTNVRQNGPARALPVQVDMDLEDIPDFELRRKVERMRIVLPNKSVLELQNALAAKKGNFDDALEFITASENPITVDDSEDELVTTPPKAAVPTKPNAKRELKGPNKSIQQKFSAIHALPTSQPPIVPKSKKKGRLMRGRRNPSPSPPPSPQVQILTSRPKAESKIAEEEDEGIVLSSDSESAAEKSDDHYQDAKLLAFLNTCSVEDLVDLSNQKEDVVRLVLSKRPFRSLDDVAVVSAEPPSSSANKGKGKGRKTKRNPVGEKVLDYAQDMWTGYQAVDELVTKCEGLAKPLTDAMSRWGVDVFGAAKSGELALTDVHIPRSNMTSARDSGIGTPKSPAAGMEEVELDKVQQNAWSKSSFLRKPPNMADDIELKDYQLVGLNWLNLLWEHKMSCILADDMGLGKTCQVIAFLSHLREQKAEEEKRKVEEGQFPGPHLVIVPGSTLENWLREFQRFSPSLVVEPYYGSQGDREHYRSEIEKNVRSIDCIVTTYDIAYKPEDNKFLRGLRPTVCVYDEGHVLRNYDTKRYKNLMRIRARFRLLLTGTPLQNNLQELASILAFIMPNLFKERQDDLAIVFKHKAKTTDSNHAALLSAQRIIRARSMMTPFVLRRKKAQVLKHLPTKTNRVEYCELTASQQNLYNEQLTRQRKVLESRAAGIVTNDHANIMMRLRQAALHPLLFHNLYNDVLIKRLAKTCTKEEDFKKSDPDVIVTELNEYSDYEIHQLCIAHPNHMGKFRLKKDEWMDSGKVKRLAKLLTRFKENGDRTLIFSQFTSVMDILESVLDTLDMAFFRLDGSTPISRRQDMLDEFYADESIPVFMLSTKSGGAGINLACANKVIIFDSSFNPQDDIQAENRAHRVGQSREVEVIRLISQGTIEEQIHKLGESKLALDDRVAGDALSSDTKAGVIKDLDAKNLEKTLSVNDKLGIEAVENMLLAEYQAEGTGLEGVEKGQQDLKDQFLTGLQAAGLDVSAE